MPKISDFLGQISDADAGDLPPGAAISQKNVSTTSAGKLKVRGGMQPATFTSTATISASNYHTFQRMCFCKTRQGDLLGVNGIDRGFRWDGSTANVEALGLTAPASLLMPLVCIELRAAVTAWLTATPFGLVTWLAQARCRMI